jgi:hypothetical protein
MRRAGLISRESLNVPSDASAGREKVRSASCRFRENRLRPHSPPPLFPRPRTYNARGGGGALRAPKSQLGRNNYTFSAYIKSLLYLRSTGPVNNVRLRFRWADHRGQSLSFRSSSFQLLSITIYR